MMNVVQSIMQNIYGSNTAYSNNNGKTFSLTSNGLTSGGKSGKTLEGKYSQYETAEMYAFVKNYHLTQAILTTLQSFITDLYRDAKLQITIKGHQDWQDYCNEVITVADVKRNSIENLEDFLYEGNQGKYFQSDKKAFKSLVNPSQFAVYYESDVPKMTMLVSSETGGVRPVRFYNGLWLQYKPITVKAFNSNKDKENPDSDLYFENEFKVGQSIFKGAIVKLYSMQIKEYLADQMALKEALKNEVLIANVADEQTSMNDISQATEMISNLVNDEESMSILSHSPEALLRLIDEKLVNYINVVPGIQNFTNFDKMDLFSLRDKLAMLQEDIANDEEKVYKTMGISRDLMNGEATKYEAMERSTRFVTLISYINSSILTSLQRFCCGQIYYKFGVVVPESIIEFNIDSTAVLTNVDTAYKFRVLQDTMVAVNEAANSYAELANNPNVDPEQAYLFFSKKLSSIDSGLVDLIKKAVPEESVDPDAGNPDSPW